MTTPSPYLTLPMRSEKEARGAMPAMRKITWGYISDKGRGVIATAAISQGETVERSPIDAIDPADAETKALDHLHFAWGVDAADYERGVGCCLGFGYLSLYNHSAAPNARYVRHFAEKEMSIIALRAIASGEELTLDYGVPLWFAPAPPHTEGGREG